VKNQTALPIMQNRKPFRERYNKRVVDDRSTDDRIRSNHYLYTERTTMHVMADLSRRDEPTTGSTDTETRLCSVTYDKARKLLTISPDFTSYGVEHERHYDVTNGYGIRFDYRIEHVFEGQMTMPLELQERCENARRVSMWLFTMDVRDIPGGRVTAFARTDQKDRLFVEKPISRHSRATFDLFALQRSNIRLYLMRFPPV